MFLLKKEDITIKNPNNNGEKYEKNCIELTKLNSIPMIYIIQV